MRFQELLFNIQINNSDIRTQHEKHALVVRRILIHLTTCCLLLKYFIQHIPIWKQNEETC